MSVNSNRDAEEVVNALSPCQFFLPTFLTFMATERVQLI